MKRKLLAGCILLALALSGCGTNGADSAESSDALAVTESAYSSVAVVESQEQSTELQATETEPENSEENAGDAMKTDVAETESTDATNMETVQESEEKKMMLTIAGNEVAVEWEENASVDALRELVQDSPLTISMSMYGGFEQVGSFGMSLPRNDEQTTTSAGDIVLYSGNQIVVFYAMILARNNEKNVKEIKKLIISHH